MSDDTIIRLREVEDAAPGFGFDEALALETIMESGAPGPGGRGESEAPELGVGDLAA